MTNIQVRYIYRAVVRREKGSWWLSLVTNKGSLLTFDLQGPTMGRPASQVPLPVQIAAALHPLLERGTVVSEAPGIVVSDGSNGMEGVPISATVPLLTLCWPEFIEQQGCILRIPANGRMPSIAQPTDRTGAEAYVNHVHLNDVFRDGKGRCSFQLTKNQCFQIAEMWMSKLKLHFPRRYFAMYLFMDDEDSHLRFHTLRPSEPLWTDLDLMFEEDSIQSSTVWFF